MGATKHFLLQNMLPFYKEGVQVGYIYPDGSIYIPQSESTQSLDSEYKIKYK